MSLEPTRAQVEAWLSTTVERVLSTVQRLENAPATGLTGPAAIERAAACSLPIPEQPSGSFDALVEHVLHATEAGLNAAGPGYLAYVPGGGIVLAGVADLISNWLNRYTGVSAASPALCRLEADVIAWLAQQFGYDEHARGLLTSGGSIANFSAVVTARHAKLGDDGDYRGARVYTTTQAHHSVTKSVALAGIPRRAVIPIETDARFRMHAGSLDKAITRDRAAGLRPFLVVSAAGTTNTGAVDPLDAIADVCDTHGLWHHVDGAYGGAFVLCPEGRDRLQGIERAQSITIDPHKGMFLPYGTGCLLVRDGNALRAAHQAEAEYLQDFDREGEPPNPTDYGPELSRDFRGLRVWLPLQLYGAATFRDALTEKLDLTARLAAGLRTCDALEFVDEPQLSVLPFRLRRASEEGLEAWNERNAAFLRRINERQRVALSSTMLPVADGAALTLRACVLSFRTHANNIDAAIEDIVAATSC